MKAGGRQKKRGVLLLAAAILLYLLLTVGVIWLSGQMSSGIFGKRLLQNGAYLLFLGLSFLWMRCAGKPPAAYGWFLQNLPMQLLAGAAIGIGLTVFLLLFGSVPAVPESFAYVLFSQLLVGFSEETFWRGFVLQTLWDTTASKDAAVLLSSLLFGLVHLPLGGSAVQVLAAFLVGIFLAVLRTEFDQTVGIPALALGHAICNIF